MKTTYQTRAQIHDQARDDANTLRSEAIDNFWRAAGAALAAARNAAGRSAQRLAYRLARRAAVVRGNSPTLLSGI